MKTLLFGFLVLAPLSARAGTADEAEYRRVSKEMVELAGRNVWAGVERYYQAMLALDGVQPSYQDHLNGAYAARSVGDVTRARERLVLAAEREQTEDVKNWLSDIDNNYGRVDLVGDEGRITLAISVMPFPPDQASAARFAIAEVEESGVFSGYLPKGNYQFGPFELDVRPLVQALTVDARGMSRSKPAKEKPVKEKAVKEKPVKEKRVKELSLDSSGMDGYRFGVNLGVGNQYGLAGVGLTIRPSAQYGVALGFGVSELGLGGSVSLRRYFGDPAVLYTDLQFGSALNARGYGPSVGMGLDLNAGPLLLDAQVGFGYDLLSQDTLVRIGLSAGRNFGKR